MYKQIINDLELYYDENNFSEIDSIIETIKNNYSLIKAYLKKFKKVSLIPVEDDEIIVIYNFNEIFRQIVEKEFNNEEINKLVEDEKTLAILYIELLERKIINQYKNIDIYFKPNPALDDETLYSVIAKYYYEKNYTFEKFIEYLKRKNNYKNIEAWLQDKVRFISYNYLISKIVDDIKKESFNTFEQIRDILLIMIEKSKKINYYEKNQIELPELSDKELENLFYEYLNYINAPKDWFEKYEYLKKEKLIKNSSEIDNSCFYNMEDQTIVDKNNDKTIKKLSRFIHEFFHSLSLQNITDASEYFYISEFPSIFYEKKFYEFLEEKKGYSKDIIDFISCYREESNYNISSDLEPILEDILTYETNGSIKKEEKIEYYKPKLNYYKELIDEMNKEIKKQKTKIKIKPIENEYENIKIEEFVNKVYDYNTIELIKNGFQIINGYQYLLNTILADNILEKSKTDSTIMQKMIEVTNNFNKMNLNKIMELFNIEEKLNNKIKSKKQ